VEIVAVSNRVKPVTRMLLHRVASAMHDGDVVGSIVELSEVEEAVLEEYGYLTDELVEFMDRLLSVIALQSLERHDSGDGWPKWCDHCAS
jgi:hypothetical protein